MESALEKPATPVKELPPRIHINQFLIGYPNMSVVEKAGFQAFTGGKVWCREEEWKDMMTKYLNRDNEKSTDGTKQ